MGFINPLNITLCVIIATLGYLYNASLSKIASLQSQIQIHKENTTNLQNAIHKQNQALESLRVTHTQANTQEIEKITLENNDCKSELKAYKNLFYQLGKS